MSSGKEGGRQDGARQQTNALLTRLQDVKKNIERLYVDTIIIGQQFHVVMPAVSMNILGKAGCQETMERSAREIQDQLMRAVRAAEVATNSPGMVQRAEKFDIASPCEDIVQRRLSFGANGPVPPPSKASRGASGLRGTHGNPRGTSASVEGTRGHSQRAAESLVEFAPYGSVSSGPFVSSGPAHSAGRVCAIGDLAPSPMSTGNCCQCCNDRPAANGQPQLVLQQQHNMVDDIRMPATKREDVDEDLEHEESKREDLHKGRTFNGNG